MTVFSLSHTPETLRAVSVLAMRIWQEMRHVVAVQQTRHILAQMDDRQLADIGISRAAAGYHVDAPVWDTGLH